MNYWKHSLLSKKKFGGQPQDYLAVHSFIDSSKLFYYDLRHRLLLHNTYGIYLCIQKFGEMLVNSDGKTILVRDIAAEHCKEDLWNVVPTLNNWFKYASPEIEDALELVNIEDARLRDFVMQPFVMSGIKATLIITHSNFGIYLIKEILGLDYALAFSTLIKPLNINEMLPLIKLKEKWQYTPDLQQLKQIEHGISEQTG